VPVTIGSQTGVIEFNAIKASQSVELREGLLILASGGMVITPKDAAGGTSPRNPPRGGAVLPPGHILSMDDAERNKQLSTPKYTPRGGAPFNLDMSQI
jgi:hypothetical protein